MNMITVNKMAYAIEILQTIKNVPKKISVAEVIRSGVQFPILLTVIYNDEFKIMIL